MPLNEQTYYNLAKLTPLILADRAFTLARRFQASSTFLKGSPLGLTTTGVSAVQTLTVTGTPTGGTFRLSFRGIKTAAIAYNAAAATVQAALEAIVSVGAGNIVGSGGALPGTAVILTFAGTLALGPQPLVVFETADNLFTGGTLPTGSVASTTVGIAAGALKAWNGALLANPTTGPAVTAEAGGTNAVGLYLAQMAWITGNGETLPSLPVAVVVANAPINRIRFAAISAGNTPAGATGIRYYVNGAMVRDVAVTTGIAQTDVDAMPTTGVTPKGPQTENTAWTASDGSHVLRGFALLDITTDVEGRVTFSSGDSTGNDQSATLADAPYFVEGIFRMGDLAGITAANGPQLSRFGRFLSGAYTDSEGIYRLGLL